MLNGYKIPNISSIEYSQKEKDVTISIWVAMYVLGIRNSKRWNEWVNQDNLKILAAGQSCEGHNDLGLVEHKDRGGLWKVRAEVWNIFSVEEILWRWFDKNNQNERYGWEVVNSSRNPL